MVLKGRLKRNVALLFSLLVIFQFISDLHMLNAYSESDIDKVLYLLLEVDHHTETVYFNSDDCRIIVFDSECTILYERLTEQMYFADLSINNYFYHKKFPDYRKEVKIAIHHHFHGSKYKNAALFLYI